MTDSPNIYTVSHLNASVRALLETKMGLVWLVGELSNISQPSSGHWYFTLKDHSAQVKCAMFKHQNRSVTFRPQVGDQVLVRARLSLYEPRGDYQLLIESMQPEGKGGLQRAFEALKNRLAAEGLFDQARKLPLPKSPTRIGIITSPTGAALYDMLNVLKRRDPSLSLIVYPTQVQGKEAAIQIAQAIGAANSRKECEVLIVGRGGGSIEDLWCFNEEIVARTIAASQIPIISAVGHETDVTIADFVASLRAPTPSAAAELVSQNQLEKAEKLQLMRTTLEYLIKRLFAYQQQRFSSVHHQLALLHPSAKLKRQAEQLEETKRQLYQLVNRQLYSNNKQMTQLFHTLSTKSPKTKIQAQKNEIATLSTKLTNLFEQLLQNQKHSLALKLEALDALSPLSTLSRGYSITKNEKEKVISSIKQVEENELLITQLNDGQLVSRIEAKKANRR